MSHQEASQEVCDLRDKLEKAERNLHSLRLAIYEHHAQKADDRCIEDDDRLYKAAGLHSPDRRVGDKAAMLENCKRYIENRCEGGGWPSYAKLHAALTEIANIEPESFPYDAQVFKQKAIEALQP